MSEDFNDSWIFALDALRERWEAEKSKPVVPLLRHCIIPGCGAGVPVRRQDKLCDQHYAWVSDAVIAQEVNKWLAQDQK